MAYSYNSCIENEKVLKVKGSHIHHKSGNTSEMVQDRDRSLYTSNRKLYGLSNSTISDDIDWFSRLFTYPLEMCFWAAVQPWTTLQLTYSTVWTSAAAQPLAHTYI